MDKHGATSLLLTISLWCKVAASPTILGLLVAVGLWFGLEFGVDQKAPEDQRR